MVPKTLPGVQRWVQAIHATAEFMKHKPGEWLNESIVVLECDELAPYTARECVQYREPDFENAVTALATTDGSGLGNLRLLKSTGS